MAADVVWNRTVNIKGGEEKNVAMDWGCELKNKSYKG